MEMDWRPGQFFDESGRWLMCATHGALFEPSNGHCVAGPCVGKALIPILCTEQDGVVYWQTAHNLEAVEF
jgi:nitrite reductase/ring-hydroxylating ferredoxin subunit